MIVANQVESGYYMSMTHLQASQTSAVQFARSWVSLQSSVGAALILCGSLADGAAGWLALSQGDGWSLPIHLPAIVSLADGAAGWLALSQGDSWSLLIHLPAILVWGIGLCVLQRAEISHGRSAAYTAPSERAAARGRTPLVPGWVMVFMLLGVVIFPGLVPAAWCIAYAFTHAR